MGYLYECSGSTVQKHELKFTKFDTFIRELYKQRHKVENMFGRLKDWRRIAMRYDHCAHTFFSAICIAVTVIFSINES
jgi:transposase